MNGVLANGYRNELTVAGPQFSGKLTFNYNTIVDSAIPSDATSSEAAEVIPSGILNEADANGSFKLATKGLVFQLGAFTDPIFQDTVGIDDVNAQNLGVAEGRLSSIVAGGENNLSNNPEQAAKIIDGAINDIAKLRALSAQRVSASKPFDLVKDSVELENPQKSKYPLCFRGISGPVR